MRQEIKGLVFTGIAGLSLLGGFAVHASASTVLDSDGDPVITDKPYTIELKTNGYGSAYFSTDSEFEDHWLAPSTVIEKQVHFKLSRGDESTGREVQEGRNYNIWTGGGTENGFLTYEPAGGFFPHGGAFIRDQRSGAMAVNFTEDQGTNGYYHNNMGLLYRQGYGDIVASGDNGHPFVVKFIKNF